MLAWLEEFFNLTIQYMYQNAVTAMDYATYILLSMFSLESSGNGSIKTIDAYFPFMHDARSLFVAIGFAIVLFLFLFNLFRSLFSNDDDIESPLRLVSRFATAGVLVYMSYTICDLLVQACNYMYKAMWAVESFAPTTLEFDPNPMSKFMDVLKGKLTEGLEEVVTIPIRPFIGIVMLIIILAILWNYMKLMLEIAERYLTIAALTYASPFFFSAIGSKSTGRIFTGFLRMYFSQFVLMTMSVFFIRTFNSAIATYYVNASMNLPNPQGGSYYSASASVAFLIMLLALLIVAQRADQYLQSTGMNVAQAGGGLMAETFAVYKMMQGAGHSVMRQVGTGMANRASSAVGIEAGKLPQAMSAFYGKTLPSNMNLTSGQGRLDGMATKMVVRSEKGTTVATSVDKALAPKNEAGMFAVTPMGDRFIQASGPDASKFLTPVDSHLPEALDKAKEWNADYRNALDQKMEDPKGYADQQAFNRAGELGQSSMLAAHMKDVDTAFGEKMPNMQNMTITPDEQEAGLFHFAATDKNGKFVTGTLEADGLRKGEMKEPHDTVSDSAGNTYSMKQDAEMPLYGTEGLTPSEDAIKFQNVTPDVAAQYAQEVMQNEVPEMGFDAGRQYLEQQGVSSPAIEAMEEQMSSYMEANPEMDMAQGAGQMQDYAQSMRDSDGAMKEFKNEQFPDYASVIPGDIKSLDFSKAADNHELLAYSQQGNKEYATKITDASIWKKPSGMYHDLSDKNNHLYYAQTVAVESNKPITFPRMDKVERREMRTTESMMRPTQTSNYGAVHRFWQAITKRKS